ncbi:hypothetical protein [Pontibacter mangrovi]|uniref:STAS/SEC14 domain-containing protein n=1 Tax=Pontibacter mangrovi TaxID=2589816 RepID=A0A501WB32_9BACT|nr:hypothetical protein [Pontibacter mangrovi]TPE45570.1 hypothetical protein FJM65_05980 [Pontibacter mangrovi]
MHNPDKDTEKQSAVALVSKNQHYELRFDSGKNRLYIGIYGFWKNRNDVPGYLSDLKKALILVNPGFTLLLDMRTLITHPPAVADMQAEAHKLLKEASLGKAACVFPIDHIATLQVEDMLGHGHFRCERFASVSEAEAWLNL